MFESEKRNQYHTELLLHNIVLLLHFNEFKIKRTHRKWSLFLCTKKKGERYFQVVNGGIEPRMKMSSRVTSEHANRIVIYDCYGSLDHRDFFLIFFSSFILCERLGAINLGRWHCVFLACQQRTHTRTLIHVHTRTRTSYNVYCIHIT